MAAVQTDKIMDYYPTSSAADDKVLVDFILQDMEKLGHRMLSMLHSLKTSNGHRYASSVCSNQARELCCTTSRLDRVISKEFPIDQHDHERNPRLVEEEEEEEENLSTGFLNIFNKYYEFPEHYEKELARLVVAEEEDAHEEDPKEVGMTFAELVKKEEEEQAHLDKSSMEYLKKRMESERIDLAYERRFWENSWGSKDGRCGGFGDATTLSPMYFTHYTPGVIPSPAAVAATTLQVYSIKITVPKDFNWPVRVYGTVAARDTVDRNRNILFSRSRSKYQELTQEDCSLCLTGPSRAIVAMDPVDFEVALTVEGVDKYSVSITLDHRVEDGTTFSLSSDRCVAEFNIQQLDRSLQATILGVRVTKGRWPFKCGCRVVCSWSPLAATEDIRTTYRQVVLLDHCGKGMPIGSDDYLHLSRKVISVESHGTLRVAIEAYGKSRHGIARKVHIDFDVQHCQISMRECSVGDATVEVAVAWSLLVNEKADLFLS
ncbi:hypothetical protein CFC21_026832 [Triticum aestivum]|uniref:DUF6598 domain-containing protein n=2 Tax=Triticum aestivum TaxID=4565 RepID=A0A9R1JCP2_WHEAT|nr:uncharacterized protein LOC123039771 [Triticum aestivum]KAF7012665.1 hypothetical protein CFC21_026832 [Triticum aestivum]